MKVRKKPHYTIEYKQEAAKRVIEQGYTLSDAAESLGISQSALRRWVKAEKTGCLVDDYKPSSAAKTVLRLSEQEELIRLRKKNNRLKMERDILKKAAVFFAKETE